MSSTVERDLRIDFFRGVALIIVLIDHIEDVNRISFVQEWSPQALGFSDAAAAFVFLSGYTFGMVYNRRMQRNGFLFSLKKATIRSAQIYAAYLVALAAVLLLGCALQSVAPILQPLLNLKEPLSSHVLSGLLMSNQPWGFPILAFYVLVLPYATVLVWLHRRCPWFAWLVPLALYVAVQCLPQFNLPQLADTRGWFFNPFAWQFLYFIGVVIGMKQPACSEPRWLKASLYGLAMAVVAVGLIHTKGPELWNGQFSQLVVETIGRWPVLTNKTTLGPLRVVHFLCVVWLLSGILSRRSAWLTHTVGKYVVIAGQRSLLVYSIGLFLTFATIPIFAVFGASIDTILIVHLDMILLSICVAWSRCAEVWRSGARNA